MAQASLEISVKRVKKLSGDGPRKAFCDVMIDGALLITGLRVVEGKNGLFVSMPQEQGKDGNWYDTVVPLTKEARQQIAEAVLSAYQSDQEPV
jgi:stage V sporulation protein G